MCSSIEQVRWLVTRMTSGIYSEWPGIAEMRACFCCRFPPKDKISAYSTVYPDGLPPDPTAPPRSGIAEPNLKALPPGHEETADPELEAEIRQLADKLADKCMKPAAYPMIDKFAAMLRDLATPPAHRREPEATRPLNPNYKEITEADVAAAVAENHARAARKKAEAAGAAKEKNVVEIKSRRRSGAKGGRP